MKLDDCFYFSSRLRINDYEVLPVFTNVNRGFNDKAQFYDVSFYFLRNNDSVCENAALSKLSFCELLEIYKYTYEISQELGYRKLLMPFPAGLLHFISNSDFFNNIPTGELYVKVDYLDFKELLLKTSSPALEFDDVNSKVVLIINDVSNSDLYCNLLSKVFAIKLSNECFSFYYLNRKKFLSSYLNKMKGRINLIVVDGVSHIDQLLFCRAKDVYVQGYFVDFLKRFS